MISRPPAFGEGLVARSQSPMRWVVLGAVLAAVVVAVVLAAT
jgi:hypothetical protein